MVIKNPLHWTGSNLSLLFLPLHRIEEYVIVTTNTESFSIIPTMWNYINLPISSNQQDLFITVYEKFNFNKRYLIVINNVKSPYTPIFEKIDNK